MPVLVRERLYIGDINDAAQVISGASSEITHVLSLLSSASISFFSEWHPGFQVEFKDVDTVYQDGKLLYSTQLVGPELKILRRGVPLRDMEKEDLLDYLDPCLDFIEHGRREGSVLVHCFAGVSRSASVVVAYLMKTERLSQEDALESLREKNEFVCPNDGFLEQLKMFEEMGFKVDRRSSVYKKFRLKLLGQAYSKGEKINSSMFGADPALPDSVTIDHREKSMSQGNSENEKAMVIYRCKKCRRVVASHENVVPHSPGEGESCFVYKHKSFGRIADDAKESECSSIFVEPLKWMTTVEEGVVQGKLFCIGCQARLGYFNWSGTQCSCGTWVTPAFQLHRSRVDASKT